MRKMNICLKSPGAKKRLWYHLASFRSVGLAAAIFFLANTIIYLLIAQWHSLLDALLLSLNRPWGIVTSAFVHADLDHLLGNLTSFSLWSALFVIVNWPRDTKTRQYSSRALLLLIFLSGFLANAIVLLGWLAGGASKNSWGASGVVYATAGACLATTVDNFSNYFRELSKPGVFWKKLVKLSLAALVMLLLVWYVVRDPRTFLNVGPEVNVYAHLWGFLLGFFLFYGLFLIRSIRRK